MDLTPMMSRHIAAIGYDYDTGELHVAFQTGSRYVYKGVPHDVYVDMLEAESAGNYHALNIRNRYVCEKVHDQPGD